MGLTPVSGRCLAVSPQRVPGALIPGTYVHTPPLQTAPAAIV